MEKQHSYLLWWFVFVAFHCRLECSLSSTSASFWRVPGNCTAEYCIEPLTVTALESCREGSLFSLETPSFSQELCMEVERCLYGDPDILIWTRMLSGIQLQKFYLQLIDWYRKNRQCPKLFVMHVQHGLGNRLRALASGLAYIQLLPYIGVLVWESDHHIGANWEDLFEDLSLVIVSRVDNSLENVLSNPNSNFYIIDYMKVAPKKRYSLALDYAISQHVYWKSAYVLKVVSSQPHMIQLFHLLVKSQFSKLTPIEPLRKGILESCPTRRPLIGFHIRRRLLHEETFVTKHPNLEYGESSARTIDKYRKSNRLNYFCATAVALLSLYPSVSIYIAADSYLSYKRWLHCVHNKVALDSQRILPPSFPNCENRSRQCIQKALIDMYCLSRSTLLFGSFWSSFTEVAHYWSSNDQYLYYFNRNSFFIDGTISNETEFSMVMNQQFQRLFSRFP